MAGDDEHLKSTALDYTNPFFLGSHDTPNLKITHVVLRRDNYDAWKNSMTRSLKSRRKYGFIDGSIKKPSDELGLDNWVVVNCTLVQWILNTIDPSLLDSIFYAEEAAPLWAELAATFSVVDGTKIHGLKTQLHECKRTKGMDVSTYYGKLKSIWDSIAVHEPPFACKCGKCECNIGPSAVQRLDNERLHQFFMGLDPTLYSNIRSQQFQLDPLPSLSRAYQVVIQEERLRASSAPADASDVVAFATPGRTSSAPVDWRALRDKERSERRPPSCTYCDTRGHDVSYCFIKTQNFPEWWGDRPRTLADLRRARAASSRGSGYGGARGGHGTSASSHQAAMGPVTSSGQAATSGQAGSSSHAGSSVQANLVTTSVSTNTVNISDRLSGMFPWIIDTGASNHVTGNLTCLEAQRIIPSRTVGLPNGHQVASTVMGSVFINNTLILDNVLYVPSLTCNLISVSQLTSTCDYTFEFAKNSCLIQAPSTRKTIGVGELRDGLYWICAGARDTVVNFVTDAGTIALWHQRLGHPSNKAFKAVSFASSLNFSKHSVCETCHFAKQHRNSFSLNNKRASELFELIHCDLWGPYRLVSSCGA
ncbi:uncharacterized protein LOC141631525 [Silene latifolia]|uniref:uncharacterized protein LOC141631525 n=1 Tax=Silene latifolia TaxID=37657 RepID=UPI003D77E8D8